MFFLNIIFILPYRSYLVIVEQDRKRHNDIRMLSLLSSHYRVYKGIILFISWVLTTSRHTNLSRQKQGQYNVRKALDQEGNFLFIS